MRHHGGAGGGFKFAAPALRLLALWVERQVVPPVPHVKITMFEDCNWAGGTSHGRACGPVEGLSREHMGTQNREKPLGWSGRRGSNPHDQLGRLVVCSGGLAQLAAVTRTDNTSTPQRCPLGRNLGRKSVLAAVCATWCSVLPFCIPDANTCLFVALDVWLRCREPESKPQGR